MSLRLVFSRRFRERVRQQVGRALRAQYRDQFGAAEFARGLLRLGALAQAAQEIVAIARFEIGDDGLFRLGFHRGLEIGVGRVECRAHQHAAFLGLLTGDDDGLRPHLAAHLRERTLHVIGNESA